MSGSTWGGRVLGHALSTRRTGVLVLTIQKQFIPRPKFYVKQVKILSSSAFVFNFSHVGWSLGPSLQFSPPTLISILESLGSAGTLDPSQTRRMSAHMRGTIKTSQETRPPPS